MNPVRGEAYAAKSYAWRARFAVAQCLRYD
jgi:hypothetical protein